MESIRAVGPLPTLAPYVGGKRNLARRIVARIEQVPHRIYAEPFVGMAGVFLRRRQAPPSEVINDLSCDVATLFRILQRHYVPFLDMLRWQLTSRTEFERLAATDPAMLTDLERAARFLYLQRTTFGGRVVGRTFGIDPARAARFDITKLAPMLEDVHERLSGVVVENLPYHDFIRRYDRPGTLFYIDPPYWGSEGHYGEDLFRRDDLAALAELLGALQGRFIMSINDVSEVRDLFSGFTIEPVETTYTIGGGAKAKRAFELLISGGRG